MLASSINSFSNRTSNNSVSVASSSIDKQRQQQQQQHVHASQSSPNDGTMEQLIQRLCLKMASVNHLEGEAREFFVHQSYTYLIKVFCSDAYAAPPADAFKLADKLRKKLMSTGRAADVSLFSELETKLPKLKVITNPASIIEFFYTFVDEQSNYECTSKKNSLHSVDSATRQRQIETPNLSSDTIVNANLIDKSSATKKLGNLFTAQSSDNVQTVAVGREQQRFKSTLLVNEGFILRELIYALQGVDGRLFQKDPKDLQSIVIKTDMVLDRSVRMLVLRYLECGWLYLRLRRFLASFNNNPSAGLVLQAFCAYISTELKEYHRLLAVLESQLGHRDEGGDCGNLTLRRLLVWLDQPFDRLKYLCIVCDAVKDKKGGVLLSTLYSYSIHGDPFKANLLRSALAKCVTPIRDMIIEWICDGQIRDLHEEFFVAFDNSVSNDRLWHDKYNLRLAQIPTFINEQQARKILVIGKSINFLRVICNEQTQIKAIKSIASIESLLDQKTNEQFQEMIDSAYLDTSSTLISTLYTKYKLLDHFNSLRRYLLLGQGDFIRHLMDLMEGELNKPANDLMFHSLQRLLDKAVTETNAQYDPPYIISRLDVRLLTVSPNDVGWDVFSLDYSMDGPLKTIFTNDCLLRYLRSFNFLWRVKRMEHTTCANWSCSKADIEKIRTMSDFQEIFHQSNIISSEMLRLVQNLNFYIMFEVLEVSWKELCEKLSDAKDMDDVIAANESFLETIISQLLLDQKSTEIASELRTIFDQIVKMYELREWFQKVAMDEHASRQAFKLRMTQIEDETESLKAEASEKTRFNNEIRPKLRKAKHQIVLLKNSFNEMVRKLLEMLKNHPNESLRFLSFRFNFNEYYN